MKTAAQRLTKSGDNNHMQSYAPSAQPASKLPPSGPHLVKFVDSAHFGLTLDLLSLQSPVHSLIHLRPDTGSSISLALLFGFTVRHTFSTSVGKKTDFHLPGAWQLPREESSDARIKKKKKKKSYSLPQTTEMFCTN